MSENIRRTKDTCQALMVAGSHAQAEIVKYLLEKCALAACASGNVWPLEALKCFSVVSYKIKSNSGVFLNIATLKGHDAITRFPLSRGAPSATDETSGRERIHSAAMNGHPDVIKAIYTHHAIIYTVDPHGLTALHCAIENGHDAVVLFLLDQGWKLDHRDDSDQTALVKAARNSHCNGVRNLLAACADHELRGEIHIIPAGVLSEPVGRHLPNGYPSCRPIWPLRCRSYVGGYPAFCCAEGI